MLKHRPRGGIELAPILRGGVRCRVRVGGQRGTSFGFWVLGVGFWILEDSELRTAFLLRHLQHPNKLREIVDSAEVPIFEESLAVTFPSPPRSWNPKCSGRCSPPGRRNPRLYSAEVSGIVRWTEPFTVIDSNQSARLFGLHQSALYGNRNCTLKLSGLESDHDHHRH